LRAGAARNRFLVSSRGGEYKPLWPPVINVARRDPVSNCPLQGGTAVRHRTSPRNGCFSASEQLFFDFRVTSGPPGGGVESTRAVENKGAKFFEAK
jgi:hypothetical protein